MFPWMCRMHLWKPCWEPLFQSSMYFLLSDFFRKIFRNLKMELIFGQFDPNRHFKIRYCPHVGLWIAWSIQAEQGDSASTLMEFNLS